jgi:L-fuconolactonase
LIKIDAHHHLWKYTPETHGWIDESMAVLKRDYMPQELGENLKYSGYTGCVAVQASQTEEETEFLLAHAEKYPFIKGVVGWLDLRHRDIDRRLKHFGKFEKLKGLRHVVQDEPDDDFLLRDDFLRGIALLSKYNLTYDLLIFPRHLNVAEKFVSKFPTQKFVLDHIAKPDIKNCAISPWKEGIRKLAKHQNVWCKLSGMVTEANWSGWKNDDFTPYLDEVFSAFGPDRLMIGSDWPVCTLAGSYAKVMGVVEKYLDNFDADVRQKVLGQNAINFYKCK